MPTPYTVRFHSTIPASTSEIFSYLSNAGSFERLAPPWENVELISRDRHLEAGSQTRFSMRMFGVRTEWLSEHVEYEPQTLIVDMQIEGPFDYWRHMHRFRQVSKNETLMDDFVRYLLPGSRITDALFKKQFRRRIRSFLRYRSRTLFNDLQVKNTYSTTPLRIVIAGASGFVGTALVAFLTACGHTVLTLSRTKGDLLWDVSRKTMDPLPECDVIINLTGENIGRKRWSKKQKKRIRDSRVKSASMLSNAIAAMPKKPRVFISASALGLYPSSDEKQTESSDAGSTFLSDVCKEWEAATASAPCRTAMLRFGVVLSTSGGVVKKLQRPFRFSGGAIMGSGRQKVSWIELNDLIYQIYHVIHTETLSGPINACAPEVVSFETFSRALAKKWFRPTWIRIPTRIVRLVFGEMGEETLLRSTNASCEKIASSGFEFAFPTLKEALRHTFS